MPWHLALTAVLLATTPTYATETVWSEPIRGTWVATSEDGRLLVQDHTALPLVIGDDPAEPVKTAARLFVQDIEKITGIQPNILSKYTIPGPAVFLHDASWQDIPDKEAAAFLEDKVESYFIRVAKNNIHIYGADSRGTAYGVYALSERLGIDPLYHWTSYTPEQHNPLYVKLGTLTQGTPAIRYRGFFHDDEDVLPRPVKMPGKRYPRPPGIPDLNGAIPLQWYEKIFETEIRLGLNMVAPYTRAQRSRLVNELASDYGLILTSHHYDALLSNPWGFTRHGLAKEQGIKPEWNYLTNKDGMVEYLSNAVEGLKDLETVWVIGVRGDRDKGYRWPKGTTDEQIMQFNSDTMELQKKIVRDITGTDPDFAMTSWAEVNEKRERGLFELKDDTILVWSDFRRAGVMVDLPEKDDSGRHGVYYHLAITMNDGYATSVGSVVSEDLLVDQWRAIFDAGATEYLLVNISEVREFIREGRMLAQISQHGRELLDLEDPASDFRNWFSEEYFGEKAASLVNTAYKERFDIALWGQELYAGNISCLAGLDMLEARLFGPTERMLKVYPYLDLYTDEVFDVSKARTMMADLIARSDRVLNIMQEAKGLMNSEQARYFDENAVLPMMMVNKPAKASLVLFDALEEESDEAMLDKARQALVPLEEFLTHIKATERPPFERWYEASSFRHSYPEIDPRIAHIRLTGLLGGKLFYRR